MISSELQLFHAMLQKLMTALSETIQMYEDYSRIHSPQGNTADGHFARQTSGWKKEDPARPSTKFNQSRYQQKMRRERVNKQIQASQGGVVLPKETLSCNQRIAALRTISKHFEKEQPKKQHQSSKESKKNTAFFLYLQEKRTSFAREYPQLKPQELTKIISDSWKAMSEEERKPYYHENIENRKEFNKNFQKCLSTVFKAQRTDPPQRQEVQTREYDQQQENDDSEWKQ